MLGLHSCLSSITPSMALWEAVHQALEAQAGPAVLDGDGSALSGPQLLRLVGRCVENVATRATGSRGRVSGPPSPCRRRRRPQVDSGARLLQQAARDAPRSGPSVPPVCAILLSNSATYVATVLAALRLG